MYISSFLSAESARFEGRKSSDERNEYAGNFPVNWQPDNVYISPEASAAYAAMRFGAEEERASDDLVKQFSEYLKEARGESVSADDPLEMIEKLKEKLEKLQGKISQAAERNENSMEPVQAQIDSIISQISELMKLVGKG